MHGQHSYFSLLHALSFNVFVVYACASSSSRDEYYHHSKYILENGQGPNNASHYYPSSSLDLVRLAGRNYFFAKNQQFTWIEAMSFCRAFGMDLTSIETWQENVLLKNHLEKIGLTNEWVLTGGHKIGRSEYAWLTGSPLSFQNWAHTQPSDQETENCLIMWRLKWYDLPCERLARSFICEQRDYFEPFPHQHCPC